MHNLKKIASISNLLHLFKLNQRNPNRKMMKKIIILIFLCLSSLIHQAQTWSAVGNGVNGDVYCFKIYNGDLYVGGRFYHPGTTKLCGLMKWDGISFDTLQGNYLFGGYTISAMEVYNNELYLGGSFSPGTFSYPSTFAHIARWNGNSFDSVTNGCDNSVYALKVYNGCLYVGGDMRTADGIVVDGIAKWNGSQWLSVGGGINPNGRVYELEIYNNELYAAGLFSFTALNTTSIARWNDSTWNEVGPGGIAGAVYSLGIFDNELYAGGPYFTEAGGVPVHHIAKWDGTNWSAVGSGTEEYFSHIFALKEYHNELYAGGMFNVMDGDSMRCIARYDRSAWDSVGTGVDSATVPIDTIFGQDTTYLYPPHQVNAFIELNDELYVGGEFNMIGGVAAHSIAKWNTPVGINELINSKPIFAFPNPTTDKIFISSQEQKTFFKLYDVAGKLLLENNFGTQMLEIDIQGFESGVYILSAGNKQQQFHFKIIKQH
jgi:hypothetical protein